MKAIILSAGQGSRLLPLTESNPKCLLDLGENETVLRHQFSQLERAGVTEVVVITGFHAPLVTEDVAKYKGKLAINLRYNPFYKVADNLGSVWLALRELPEDCSQFMIVNGDTLFTASVASELLMQAHKNSAPVTLAVSQKPRYDSDDMKVIREGSRLTQVGKSLSLSEVNAESIGMMCFQGSGVSAFRAMVESAISAPDGTNVWYLSVIHRLASKIHIETAEVPQENWCEIDFPADYENACEQVKQWRELASS